MSKKSLPVYFIAPVISACGGDNQNKLNDQDVFVEGRYESACVEESQYLEVYQSNWTATQPDVMPTDNFIYIPQSAGSVGSSVNIVASNGIYVYQNVVGEVINSGLIDPVSNDTDIDDNSTPDTVVNSGTIYPYAGEESYYIYGDYVKAILSFDGISAYQSELHYYSDDTCVNEHPFFEPTAYIIDFEKVGEITLADGMVAYAFQFHRYNKYEKSYKNDLVSLVGKVLYFGDTESTDQSGIPTKLNYKYPFYKIEG